MTSIWSSFTYALLPPAVVLLMLMTIPFPVPSINKGIVKLGDIIFNIRIGTLSIFMVITTLSFVVLCAQTYDLQQRYIINEEDSASKGHYAADLSKKATRWRTERNWWISALTFTIYWMLLRFHAMKKTLLKVQLKEQRRLD